MPSGQQLSSRADAAAYDDNNDGNIDGDSGSGGGNTTAATYTLIN